MICYRHAKNETNVCCGKCDRPICTKCMVAGPVGMRCPECASLRSSSLYRIPAWRLALAIIGAMIAGVIGAELLSFVSFFVFFIGPAYGGVVAEVVLRAAGRKRGRILEVIGVGSIVFGALVALLPMLLPLIKHGFSSPMSGLAIAWPLIGFALAVSACYSRLKFF